MKAAPAAEATMPDGRQPCTPPRRGWSETNQTLAGHPRDPMQLTRTPILEQRPLRILIAAFALTLMAPTAYAQSILLGAINGVARDELARPMQGVHIILTEVGTGVGREQETSATGRFEFLFLPPGSYEVFAEQLGYRPIRVRGIAVRPGRSIPVSVSLAREAPPVMNVDTVEFRQAASGLLGAAASRVFSSLAIEGLPHGTRELAELGRLSSSSNGSLATEGLPGRLSGVVIDGVAYTGAMHTGLTGAAFPTAPFPLLGIADAELLTNGIDVEYAGFASASLSGYTARGTRRLQAKGFGDWLGLRSSEHFDLGNFSHNTVRGGFLVSGPIISDTAHFVLGGEVRHLETPMPRAWTATTLDSALLAVASDSFGVDLAGYLSPRRTTTDIVSAFGRFDGQINEGNAVSLRANFARLSTRNPRLSSLRGPELGADLDGTDLSTSARLTSMLSASVGLELRVGLEFSKRAYSSGNLPATLLTEEAVAFGADPVLPTRLERVAFRANETLHFRVGTHQFKLGGSAVFSSTDQTLASGRRGQFAFSGVDDFAALAGSFVQSVGPPSVARFSTVEFGVFLQDRWQVAPALEIAMGFRVDAEVLPDEEVPLNTAWLELTGLANDDFNRKITKFSPRFGLRWDVGNRHRWLVRAEAGFHHGIVDPSTFAEVVTQSGRLQVRRGFGRLGRWVETPDSNSAPVLGPSLALLGPDFAAPRTFRTSLGIGASLGPALEFDVSAAYRHTDFLSRRHDLNLLPAPSARDQYGRPIYGTLIQRGGLLAAEPGSNRRFAGFDRVSVLDVDGSSDYWGITARLQGRVGSVASFFASYTYSRVEDNWLSGHGNSPGSQLTPFPEGLNGRDWADGRSDFDVPHRVVAGGELDLGVVRLAGFYRFQSGFPFTPGFRDGVDANGDGSFNNDPAFVDDAIAGAGDLFNEWECLRVQVGRFARRNSCRGDPIHTLDVRVVLRAFEARGYSVELVADGVNLLDPEVAELDRALYLVDASGALVTDPVLAETTVPLLVNPNFGQPVRGLSTGRFFRVGLRVGY